MKKLSRIIVVGAAAALALASIATPAAAHKGKGKGKKPMGTIASFDGTTLTVTTTDGATTTATYTEDSKIKVEHRGHHDRSGRPSEGDAADLTAGAFVLKMKTEEDGTLERIRVRPATHDEAPAPDPTETPEIPEAPAPDPTETPEIPEAPAPDPTETPESPAPDPTETPSA